ncbi:MAG: porin family protein [Proteobacteria bacterium]|nr:porin family protein [Pseudomonadota bacterium]
MKKISLALCLASALFANSASAQWQGNWLLGVSGSYNWYDNGDFEGNISHPTGRVTNFGWLTDDDNEDDRWAWGVFGGYQARCNGWLFGAELAIDWIDNDDQDNNNFVFTDANAPNRGWVGNAGFSRDYAIALTGRFGYEVFPFFMPYVRAGVETSRDKISFGLLTADNAQPFLIASGDGRRQSYCFIGGFGAEVPLPLADGLAFRAEWNYHSDGRTVDASGLANDNATLVTVSNQQSVNTVKASLVFNFPT